MIGRLVNPVMAWAKRVPSGWLVAGASVLGVIVLVGSMGMYRVYDYVQHDNDFCMSCHLMSGPFARFEKSAHRGLGCKACHRPNIVQRAKMGLTQVLEMPDSISHHAEVPNGICAECHVKGNPEEWKQISNSLGHRLHLESGDPNLKGLRCLDCHGAGIHEFAPVDKTCAKAGCHENTKMQLGKMSGLTIHCASCHDFTKPVPDSMRGNALNRQITPRGADCFSCHAMRQRVASSIPVTEPHNGVCGTCHNPHEQSTPAAAVRSCTAGGCHARVDTVSVMHRGLASGVVQNCTTCHKAHTWKVKAEACTSCHKPDELDDGAARLKDINARPATMSVGDVVLLPMRLSMALVAQLAPPSSPFRHKVHKGVACKACHESVDGHGALKMRAVTDCSGCHHATASEKRCTSCHGTKEIKPLTRSVEIKTSVAKDVSMRTLSFAHTTHSKLGCSACHANRSKMRAVPSCGSCHDDHHTELRTCTSCHTDVIKIPAHNRSAHVSCAGSGCHKNTVTTSLRTQRAVCLACHTDQATHEPGGDCATCHLNIKKADARAAK